MDRSLRWKRLATIGGLAMNTLPLRVLLPNHELFVEVSLDGGVRLLGTCACCALLYAGDR